LFGQSHLHRENTYGGGAHEVVLSGTGAIFFGTVSDLTCLSGELDIDSMAEFGVTAATPTTIAAQSRLV